MKVTNKAKLIQMASGCGKKCVARVKSYELRWRVLVLVLVLTHLVCAACNNKSFKVLLLLFMLMLLLWHISSLRLITTIKAFVVVVATIVIWFKFLFCFFFLWFSCVCNILGCCRCMLFVCRCLPFKPLGGGLYSGILKCFVSFLFLFFLFPPDIFFFAFIRFPQYWNHIF